MSNDKFNQDSYGQQLIIIGLLELVEKEGYTPHEALEAVKAIESNIYFALCEIKQEG